MYNNHNSQIKLVDDYHPNHNNLKFIIKNIKKIDKYKHHSTPTKRINTCSSEKPTLTQQKSYKDRRHSIFWNKNPFYHNLLYTQIFQWIETHQILPFASSSRRLKIFLFQYVLWYCCEVCLIKRNEEKQKRLLTLIFFLIRK